MRIKISMLFIILLLIGCTKGETEISIVNMDPPSRPILLNSINGKMSDDTLFVLTNEEAYFKIAFIDDYMEQVLIDNITNGASFSIAPDLKKKNCYEIKIPESTTGIHADISFYNSKINQMGSKYSLYIKRATNSTTMD